MKTLNPFHRLRSTRAFLLAGAAATLIAGFDFARREPQPAAAILQDLKSFRVMATVLHVGAHPDDENTQLITYLARGRGYRTAYLSVTRGDGGQNLLGPQLGEKLGVARTQELLAARRLDGGRQFFTRAIDYGFSKDVREALRVWDRDQVLGDVVRVIRRFRPDVIITRFSPEPGGTHGHHTASAVLALEAFKLAGDPKAYPEQIGSLTPWQPKRILMNGRAGGPGGAATAGVQLDVGGDDPVLGESFASIAARSRAMHKTQGFGQPGQGGGGGGGGGGRGAARAESFQLLAGEPATRDIMDGIDTTWSRVQGGAEIGRVTDLIIARFNAQDVSASVPALLELRGRLRALRTADPLVAEKRNQLDGILQACLGLEVETLITNAEVVPGDTLAMTHTARVQSAIPVRWVAVRYPGTLRAIEKPIDLKPNQPATQRSVRTLPVGTPLTQPYWLRQEPGTGMYRVADASLIGTPENAPEFSIEHVFEIGGQTLIVRDQPVQITRTAAGELRRPLDVISPVSLRFAPEVALFPPGGSRAVTVEVTALRAGTNGTVRLNLPAGWKLSPATQQFRLANVGDKARFTFNLTSATQSATAQITARADVNGRAFVNQRIEVSYEHLPVQLLQPPARLEAVSLNLAVRGREVGYLPGAGDLIAESLEQMGYHVTTLTGADLTPEKLRGLDAVVIGIRAFNVRTDLEAVMPALFAYVAAGGNVIAQYNQTGLKTNTIAPFPLTISQDRVTDEHAAVSFLAPDHPVLNTPNKITSTDFEGWVQERGLYYPNQWDARFTAILASSDAGEAPLKGGLLIARHGEGYFIYTSLSFFRQLPAGVPGAYRLFANLVSLGKSVVF